MPSSTGLSDSGMQRAPANNGSIDLNKSYDPEKSKKFRQLAAAGNVDELKKYYDLHQAEIDLNGTSSNGNNALG